MVVLYGPSGTGKTVLLRAIAGETRGMSGGVQIGTYRVDTLEGKELAAFRRKIGIFFPSVPLLNDRTILENLILPLDLEGKLTKNKKIDRVQATAEHFLLGDVLQKYPNEISLGQRTLALLARAVVTEPLVLLVDEPTAMLDEPTTAMVLETLRRENRRGMTILLATHNPRVRAALPEAEVISLSNTISSNAAMNVSATSHSVSESVRIIHPQAAQ